MRRKRLQHHADTLCHIFCGWEIMADWANLSLLREGILEIDLLEDSCQHNGNPIEPLEMNHILKGWLFGDLQENKIPIEGIKKAKLKVTFKCELIPPKPDKGINCKICCMSTIETAEKVYSSIFNDTENWLFKALPDRKKLEALYVE